MSTENAQTPAALTPRAQIQIALVEHWQRWETYLGDTPEQLRVRADRLLSFVEGEGTPGPRADLMRAELRAELESRFDPEARKLDRFVAGWLSAAEHLTADPLTGEAGS